MVEKLWLIFTGLSCGIVIAELANRYLHKQMQKVIDLQKGVIEKYESIMLKIMEETKQ